MSAAIALLRAVNLGAHGKVAMPALKEMFAALGFADPRTLLQSGNVVFGVGRQTPETIERLLERESQARLALDTTFFVRTAAQWRAVIEANPFPDEARRDPSHLVLVCLKEAPTRAQVAALQAAIRGREVVAAHGPHAYLTYPDGIGRSKVTAQLIERHLVSRGTGRNWNTVLKLGALAGA